MIVSGIYGMNAPNLPMIDQWWFPIILSLILMVIALYIPRRKDMILTWWEMMDSNHRSLTTTDLQSAPFGHSGNLPMVDISGLEPLTFRTSSECSTS